MFGTWQPFLTESSKSTEADMRISEAIMKRVRTSALIQIRKFQIQE